jgi:hypothetical protein
MYFTIYVSRYLQIQHMNKACPNAKLLYLYTCKHKTLYYNAIESIMTIATHQFFQPVHYVL